MCIRDRADVRLPESAEEDAQHRVGVGGGADRGAGVGTHPLLVDDDRCRQPFEYVDLRPGQRRHETLHEGAVSLVDQALRLRGDRVEHQRALARAGDAGEHRQPALWDLDADVLEVVLARALHADEVVAVGMVQCRRLRVRRHGGAHAVSISCAWQAPMSQTAANTSLCCMRVSPRMVTNPLADALLTPQRRLVTWSRSPEPWLTAEPLGFGTWLCTGIVRQPPMLRAAPRSCTRGHSFA